MNTERKASEGAGAQQTNTLQGYRDTNASYTCTLCGHTHNASSRIGRDHKRHALAAQEECDE